MSVRSIERSVARVHVASIVASAIAIVAVGAAMMLFVVVRQDDANALALTQALGLELAEHAAEPPSVLRETLREELAEQRFYQREIEIWRGPERLDGDADGARLRPDGRGDGCRFEVRSG